MKDLIPVYYSEYGRYIARYRSFPLDVDCLKPAERRVLLGLYDIAKDKLVKSLKIDGYVVGSYHPHGSCYGTLVGLVREGFASSAGGSWGGPGLKEDFGASASRYCVTGDTLITTDNGCIRIGDLFKDFNIDQNTKPFQLDNTELNVLCKDNKFHHTSHLIYSGYHDIVEVKTNNGVPIKCTPNHPFLIAAENGFEWCESKDLKIGTIICQTNINNLNTNNYIFSEVTNVEPCGKDYVYDLTVPNDHSFVANGYIVHNTETHLEKWVENFAFELFKFVPWEVLEMENEPLYLPSIFPIGLIGDGISIGIGYSKSVMPKYTMKDLAKRLLWLIKNKGKPNIPEDWNIDMDEKIFGPKILPNVSCCDSFETNPNEAYKILMTGSGSITYSPKYKITTMAINKGNKVKQIKLINLLGRVPNTSFKTLVNAWNDGLYSISNICDGSKGNNIDITIEVKNSAEIDSIRETIWNECLIKPVQYSCIVCNLKGQVVTESIDTLLLNGFKAWIEAKKLKLIQDIKDLNKSIVSNEIRLEIKRCLKGHTINTFDELMKVFNPKLTINLKEYNGKNWAEIKQSITENDVKEVYKSSSIQRLIEYKSAKENLDNKFSELELAINNLNKFIISKIQDYCKNDYREQSLE